MYQTSQVIIRNDVDTIGAVVAYAKVIASQLGLNDKEIGRICYALEDTLQNIILFDFDEKDDAEQIVLDLNRVPSGIEIIITYQGIPRNPFIQQPENLKEILSTVSLDATANESAEQINAISNFVIHKLIDRYTQKNLGSKGRSVTLLLHASGGKINEEAQQYVSGQQQCEEHYDSIRLAKADDSTDISRLFYKSYGYSYVNDIVYYPLRLVESFKEDALLSVVALSDTKSIIGHIALMQPYANARITEWGMAVSDPAFRGEGIMTHLIEQIMHQGSISHHDAIFAHSVTNHGVTQKICKTHGFSVVALLLGYAPIGLSFKDIHGELTQRESTLIDYKPLKLDTTSVLFPPDKHRAMIEKLYGGIGVTLVQEREHVIRQTREKALLSDTIITALNVAEIIMERSGRDAMEQIRAVTRKLCIARVDILFLFIDLEDPEAVDLVEGLEQLGYIFGGIFPRYHHKNSLILQYLNNIRFDYDKIVSLTPLAMELKNYIRKSDPNQIV